MFRFDPSVGAEQLGATVYELPLCQSMCPYHHEYVEEEWLPVLEGMPTLRHADGEDVLEPWDVVCFRTGPQGALLRRRGHRGPLPRMTGLKPC